jgi:mono/diheme cytochrome c family protein
MKAVIRTRLHLLLWSVISVMIAMSVVAGCSMMKRDGASKEAQAPASRGDPKAKGDPNSGVERGRELFNTVGCMACHKVNGKGGDVGPDLSDEGDKGRSRQWLITQIRDPKANDPQTIMPAYDNLSSEKVSDIVDYLMSLSARKKSESQGPEKAEKAGAEQTAQGGERISLGEAGEKWSEVCGRCHNLRAPSEYSDAQWTVAMDQMRLLVPLTGEEQSEILEFLKASN